MTIPVSIVRLFIFGVLLTAAALAVDNDALAHHTQTDTSNLFRVWCDEHYALVNIRSVPNAYSGGNRQRACRIPNRNRGQDFENCLRFPLPSGYGTPYLEGTANILPPDTPVCEVVIPDNVRGDELRDGYDASNRAQTNRPGGTLQAENIPGGIRVFGWTPPFSGNWPEYQLHRMDDQGVVIVFSHVADASSAGEAFDYGETLPLVAGVQYQFKIRPVASDGITFGDFSLPTPAQLEYAAIPARVVTVFISDSTNGTVSAEWSGDANLQNEGTVPAETNVTFTARPDDDFYVSGWSGDCESAGDAGDFAAPGAPQTCVRTAAMNVTVGAVFTQGLVCEGGLVIQDGECVVDSAGLYEHYFPAADRVSKCQALDGDQVVVDVRDPNAADPAANVAYFCNTRNVGDVCYLRKDGDYAAGIEGLRTHPGGFNFLDPVTHPPPPVCTDYAPPCYDEDDDLDHFQNPFTANCAGPPGSGPRATVFISTSANGTVSAESSGGLEVQNEGTVPVGTTVTFTAEPESGYGFSAWTGACQGEANPCALAVTVNATVGADFARSGEYTGACALAEFDQSIRAGVSLQIAACDAKGWGVADAFGIFCYCDIKTHDGVGCLNPVSNSRIGGRFDTADSGGNTFAAYYFGNSLEHLPQKTEDNKDSCFVAKCTGGLEPSGFNMNGETECAAPPTASASVFISTSANGTVSAGWDEDSELQSGETVPAGTTVTFTAEPESGYGFSAWTGDCAGEANPCALEAAAAVTVGAEFVHTGEYTGACALANFSESARAGLSLRIDACVAKGWEVGEEFGLFCYCGIKVRNESSGALSCGVPRTNSRLPGVAANGNVYLAAYFGDSLEHLPQKTEANKDACFVAGCPGGKEPSGLNMHGETECRSPVNCGAENREQLSGTYVCGECLTGFEESGGACVQGAGCAGEGKQDGANPGECGGCLASHAADGDGDCHLRVDCAGLNKIQTNEYTCGDCLADFTEDDSELCRANADCAAAFKVQTNPYTCGACLPDHTQSGDDCIPDVDCAALFRVQATPGQCGNCLANYIPAPSGLVCQAVAPPPPPDSVSVFISTSANGTVSAGWDGDANLQNEGTVPLGATVTFTATPAAGHAFSAWTGDCQGEANPCVVDATADVTVGAVFAENCTKSLIDAAGGDLAQVECNLRAGADVNATGGNNNRSPLHWAVIGQQVEIIRLLLAAAGIDPNVRDGTYGSNPLIEAAFHGRAEIAGILANHHLVDLNIASNSGNRALHDAAGRGHLAVVNTLLAAGAEVNPQNNASRTPLGEAQNGGHGAIAARLIAAGGHYGTACHLLGGTVNPSAASPPCLGLPPLNLSAGALYEHYFPSSGRGAKCEGYSASAVGSALFANSSGTGAGAGYACRDAGSSICYLSHNNTPPNSLWRAGGHALNPATPECPAFRPPCLGASGQPDNARNPFAEACLGAVLPPLVSVVFAESPNGTVSAQWKFDPDLRGGEALPAGTTVTFTAEPEPDHEFSAWTDACAGEANPCVVPVTVNATVGAEFARTAAASVAVNYSKLPGGHESNGGTLAEADGRASGFQVAAGATVTFTAAPNPGWTVTWNDESGCDGGVTVCEVVAVADVNLTAIFGTGDDALLEKYFPGGGNQHCATVGGNTDPLTHPGSGGDVIGRECFGVSVGETACVQLGESFDPSRDIWNSNGDILNDYSSGIPPLCSQEYPPCDGAQVKPDGNPFAACVDPPPQVSYSKLPGGHASNGGAVTVIGQQRDAPFEVAPDATVTFTATPNPGWTVTWNDESGCDDEELTCEVIASGDLKVTAIFDAGNDALLEEYFPAADPHQHCQILGGHISYTVVDSGSAPFTVVGRLCARQFGFSVDCMQLGNAHDPVRRARDGDEIDLLDPYPPLCSEEYPPCDGPGETKPGENPFAACVAPPAVVSVFITPSPGGIVSARWGGNPDLQNEETVPFGTQVTFAAEPDPGRAFANWTGDCQGRPNPCVREAAADLTVGATFPLLVTISRDRPDNAELSAVLPPDADPLPTLLVTFADLPVRFTADPAPGHFIAEWQGVPPGQSCPPPGDVGQAQTCEITPAANLHIAVVARLARRLFYSHSPGGTVRAEDSENRTVPDRGEIRDRFRLVATPDPGFFIALWRADGADGAETCPAGIAADSAQTCPLQAQSRNAHAYVKFQPARRVSVAAAENGTVAARDHPDPAQARDLSGGGLIPDGATLHLTATPDDGHFIFEWLGAPEDNACPKGQAVTVATECAFPVRRDLEAGAVFAALPESVMRIEISEAYLRENCKVENFKPKGTSSHATVGDLKNSANETIGAFCSAVPNLFDLASTYRCYALSPDSIGTPPSEFESDAQALKSCGEELFCANRGVQALDGNYFNQLPENCPLVAHRVTIVQTGDGGLRLYREDGETEILAGTDLESGTSVVFAASPSGQHYISEWHGLDGCPVGFSTQFQLIPGGGYRVDCPVRISGPLTVSVSFARTPAAVSVLYSHSSGGTLRASVSAGSLSSGGTVGLLATVDFSAVADSGFYVSGWVGAEVSHCASGVGATLVLCRAEAVRHPLEVRADFAAEAVFHRVDFSSSSGGTLRVLDLRARRVVSGSQPGVLSGSLLRLDADADSGFHLFGWGGWPGASSCGRGVFTVSEVCEVRAESPLAVRAEFRRFHRADFSAGGAGGGVGGTGGTVSAVDFRGESVLSGGRVSGGTTVTFTAVPAADFYVSGWVGGCDGAGEVGGPAGAVRACVLPVSGDVSAEAVFVRAARVLIAASAGGVVSAEVSGGAAVGDGGTIPRGSEVVFTAEPDAGFYVLGWSGDCEGAGEAGGPAGAVRTCVLTAGREVSAGAIFVRAAAVFITVGANGTVSAEWSGDAEVRDGEAVPAGTTVTFTAEPDADFYVSGWVGGCAGVGGRGDFGAPGAMEFCELEVGADVTVGAVFAPGLVCDSGLVIENGECVFAPAALYEHYFPVADRSAKCAVAAADTGTTPLYDGTDPAVRSEVGHACFDKVAGADICFQAADGRPGSSLHTAVLNPATPGLPYPLNANAEKCSEVRPPCLDASGALDDGQNPFTDFCTGLPAVPVSVFISPSANGAVSAEWSGDPEVQDGETVPHRTAVTFTARPDADFYVSGWSGDCEGAGDSGGPPGAPRTCGLTARKNVTVGAVFVRAGQIFITDSPNGTVSAEWAGDANLQSEGTVPLGTAVTFTASPDAGFYVSGWSGGCDGAGATGEFASPGTPRPCELEVGRKATVGAVFTRGLACNAGFKIDNGACVADPAAIYEHYFPAADRLSKCDAVSSAIDRAVEVRDAGQEVARICRDQDQGMDLCYLKIDGGSGIANLATHPGGYTFTAADSDNASLCTDTHPPCYDSSGALDDGQNPFADNCAGLPSLATVFISPSANGAVSAEWSGDANLQNGETVLLGATVTFTAAPADGRKLTLWTGACAGDSVEDAKCVLADVAMDVTVGAEFGCLDFHESAAAGNLAGLKCGAAAGADVNAPDAQGRTPLHLAAGGGRLEAARELLTLGATLNALDDDDETPLTKALAGNHMAVFALLVAAGGRHAGAECGPAEVPNSNGASPPCEPCGTNQIASGGVCESCGTGEVESGGACECAADHAPINGLCVHKTNALPETERTCAEVFSGDWVDLSAEHGPGKGVCSGVDINDTFCLMGAGSALPCLGLFNHVRSCNLLSRPALDPWHCGKACPNGASGARCLE